VRGVCHNCKILLVEANTNSNNNLAAGAAAAVAAGATEVSSSYGGAEGTSPLSTSKKNNDIAQYDYPGVVITASTGDDGWYDWDDYNDGDNSANSPEIPSSLPDVVSVGGTSPRCGRWPGAHKGSSLTLYGHANSASPPYYDVTQGYNTSRLAGAGQLATGGNDWCAGASSTTCASTTNTEKGNSNPNGLGKGLLSCVFNSGGTAQANYTQCTAAAGFDGPAVSARRSASPASHR
jgi:hypothetical protein